MNGSSDNQLDTASNDYWNYTSVGFGDFNDDGLPDLFVGGFGELRVALNIGTKDAPKFGLRKNLLDVNGLPVSVVPPSETAVAKAQDAYRLPRYSGVDKSFITPVDWDGDGVMDLLVTHLYGKKETKDPVVFFRGVKTDKGLRFLEAKPLFSAPNALKTFPGCQPNITVTDYNHDGVPDLVIGISLPTINGNEMDSLVAWSYYRDLGIEYPGKDAGRALEWTGGLDNLIKKVEASPDLKSFYLGRLNDYKYLTLRHKGFVYVMYGKKNPTPAVPVKGLVAKEEVKPPANEAFLQSNTEGAVSYEIRAPKALNTYKEATIEVSVNIKDGWYGYANTKANQEMGWIPIQVSYELPDGFEAVGDPVVPKALPKGTTDIYKGSNNVFARNIRVTGVKKDGTFLKGGSYPVTVSIIYQTCNEEMCLPPVTEKVQLLINLIKE